MNTKFNRKFCSKFKVDRLLVYENNKNLNAFLDFKRVYKAKKQKVYNATNLLSFTNLEQGEYAIAVFHDANANQKLDKNFLGIPKEALGFSIGKMKAFGPPTFEECKFVLDENKTIKIELSKW